MASFYSLGELILIAPDLSSISIGLDTSDEPQSQTITVAENKLTSTGYNFGNVEENIYVSQSAEGKELLVKDGYKIKYVEYPKTVGNGGTLYKPGTTFNSVRDSTKTTYISIEAVSSKISIDLTTLTGWDNVSSGTHEISVVAKATGYLDSEKSTAVSFIKASTSTGETWIMNSQIETETEFNANIYFKDADGDLYSNITCARYTEQGEPPDGAYGISFDGSYVYNTSGSITGWHNEIYRTITFLEEPTGDLLTWLQANGTKQGGSVSKNWKFNGTSGRVPQRALSNRVDISGEIYNDTTFVENFDYIYYADDWSYISFGQAGFWDISQNQWGKYGGNILKFNTEPSGKLLAFLQAHAQPI